MIRVCLAATIATGLLLAACGGHAVARPAHRSPRSPAARIQLTPPARLRAWEVGETFTGALTFDELDQGTVEDELRFTAHERLQVVGVGAGAATIRVGVTSWRWQRNTSELLTRALPPPATFGVDPGGAIVSGVDWPLPSDLPLPGLDLFAAPLTPGSGWSRSDGQGAAISYRGAAGSPPGAAALDWSVVRFQFTTSGEPVTVSGHAQATIFSTYGGRGVAATLRSTREQATFERTTQTPAGTSHEAGTIRETTDYSSP